MTEPLTPEERTYLEAQTSFTVYDPTTGAIHRSGWCRRGDLGLQVRDGEAVVFEASADDLTQYVLEGEVVNKPIFAFDKLEIAADGLDEAVMTGLPSPVTVIIDGTPHEVTGGTLEIASIMPAVYRVVIIHWPYMPFSAEVVAI